MSSHDVYRHANKVLVYSLVSFSCGQHEKRRNQHGKGGSPVPDLQPAAVPAPDASRNRKSPEPAFTNAPAERGVPLIPASSPPAPPAREPSSSNTRLLKLSAYSPKSRMSYTPGRRCGVLHASFSGSRPGPHKKGARQSRRTPKRCRPGVPSPDLPSCTVRLSAAD